MRENSNTYFQCIWLSQINQVYFKIFILTLCAKIQIQISDIFDIHKASFLAREFKIANFWAKIGLLSQCDISTFSLFYNSTKACIRNPFLFLVSKFKYLPNWKSNHRTFMRQFSNRVIDQKGVILLNLLPQLCSVFCNLEQTITHEVAPWWAEPRHQKFPTKRMWAQFRRGWHILILFSLCSLTNSQWHKDGLEVSFRIFWILIQFWILIHFWNFDPF